MNGDLSQSSVQSSAPSSPTVVVSPAHTQVLPPNQSLSTQPQPTPWQPRPTRPETVNVWGTEFAKLNMQQTIELADEIVRRRKPEYFVTANVNYLMLTEQVPSLVEVNQRAAAILADGQPIVTRSRLGPNPLPCRVAGADMIVGLARLAAERGYRVYFLGGAPNVAQKAALQLRRRFPALSVAGCHAPPFRQLSSAEHTQLISTIHAARPDILLVAFGQPKGELWIYENRHELGVPLSIQLGASFDFLAGTARRSPRCWQTMGCEWVFRAMTDPLRLVPRYARNALYLARRVTAELITRAKTRPVRN